MDRSVAVVAGCIERGGRFLLCRRPLHKRRGGQWEFPGGKLEPGETSARALERELMEELSLAVRVLGPIAQTVCAYPDLTVRLELLSARIERGEPRLNEHTELRWVTPEQALELDLCPADRELLRQITEGEHVISG